MAETMSRRRFVQTTAGAGAWISLSGTPSASVAPRPAPSAAQLGGWFDRPMRWVQLTLVENDPGRFDPRFWLDYFRRLHADAATLSAGGIVAYYPTEVPLHHRSAWLGDADPFGALVAGCRAMGMHVVARTDPHAVREDVRAAHPDWIAVNADGSPRRHWANPDLWVTCALGPYHFDFMDRVHREIVEKYRVDGIFANRWAPQGGDCYCTHCQRNFESASGHELPRTADRRDPVRRAFIEWRKARLTELWKHWDATVRAANPEARFVPNGPPDMKTAGELAPIQFADYQARRGLMPPWANGRRAKEYRSAMGSRPLGGIFSVGLEEPYRWKDSVQSEPEIRLWVAEGTANGMRPWVTKFSGVLYDRRWLPMVERIYDWHYTHERYLRNEAPLARLALLHSEQTSTYYPGAASGDRHEDHVLGMYHALVESRVPFELVHEAFLTPDRLEPFRLLVLPDAAALSDTQCEAIRAFVRRGGSLLATFASSLYDETGGRRANFALSDLFGVSFADRVDGPMQNSYLALDADPGSGRRHPILAGFEDAPRIINGVYRLDVKPDVEFPSPVTLIPSYPDLPMEDVYPRVPRTSVRELYLRELGRSRIAYIPWDIDRTFWDVMCVDHLRLLRNVIAWTANEPPPVEVEGPGMIDVTIWRQRGSVTVHLVNLTNPMFMKGPLREIIPIGPLQVRVRLPQGAQPRAVQLLTAGTTAAARTAGGVVTLTVPAVDVHEVVAIDLEGA
ncbi:MAG TPA: alpha-amylase family protein [Vicinamibacterales bacterium]|nr:alpha-amylase family protein [Vicinamibacterales bacterium]